MLQLSRLPFCALPILLAACASAGDDYPSLAVRDVERVSGTMAVEPAAPLLAPPAATLASLEELAASARAAHQRFLAAEPQARAAARAGAGTQPGSERWAVAQVAIADLEAQRSQTMIALADIDRIFVAAAVDAENTESISAVLSEVNGLVAQQDAVIRDLLAL